MHRRARRKLRRSVACQRRTSTTPTSSVPTPASANAGSVESVSGAEAPSLNTVSPALVVSGECTVKAPRSGSGVVVSVGMTESVDDAKNDESKAPSEESTWVAAPEIAVAPRKLGKLAALEPGSVAGTNAAVNCAAAVRGAIANAMTATAAAHVLTIDTSGQVSMLAGCGRGHFRCHAGYDLAHAFGRCDSTRRKCGVITVRRRTRCPAGRTHARSRRPFDPS